MVQYPGLMVEESKTSLLYFGACPWDCYNKTPTHIPAVGAGKFSLRYTRRTFPFIFHSTPYPTGCSLRDRPMNTAESMANT